MKNILAIIGWAIVITLITVDTAYESPPYGWSVLQGWGPSFSIVDYVLLLAGSLVVGMILVELEMIFWGWIGSVLLSFLMSVIYSSLYNWFVIGWGEILSDTPWGWENVFYLTTAGIFRITFPSIVLLFVGLFFGGLVGELTGIGRKISSAFSPRARKRLIPR